VAVAAKSCSFNLPQMSREKRAHLYILKAMSSSTNMPFAHRVTAAGDNNVSVGTVGWSPVKSLWFVGMATSALVGGIATFTWPAFALFVASTALVLLFGHSLGSHRKLIHNSFQCPRWLEYGLVYLGVQVGLCGPLCLLRQHELRDFAQRLPLCHDYLRHGGGTWRDAWCQLNCDLHLAQPPKIHIEPRIADDFMFRRSKKRGCCSA
jgi:hypothetical protein